MNSPLGDACVAPTDVMDDRFCLSAVAVVGISCDATLWRMIDCETVFLSGNPNLTCQSHSVVICAVIFFITACEDDTKKYLDTDIEWCFSDEESISSISFAVRIDYPNSDPYGEDIYLEWSYNADEETLTVTHGNVTFNCCPDDFHNWVEIEGNTIMLHETEYFEGDDICACMCPHTLTTHIPDIAPGTYTLEIYGGYGGEIGSPDIVETLELF